MNDVETIREALVNAVHPTVVKVAKQRAALQALERLSASRDEALGDVHGLSEGLLAATERAQRLSASRERYREALERQRRECPDTFCFCENVAYEALTEGLEP